MPKRIDINADVGERPETLMDGREEELIRHVSSANIACGAHAGDLAAMAAVVGLCKKHGVSIGAHPGFADRANFGRVEIHLPPNAIEQLVYQQVHMLADVARGAGCEVRHVKPHGGLYNLAVKNVEVAEAVGRGVGLLDNLLILIGLAGSPMLTVWSNRGFRVLAEAFVDRRYQADGTLRPRRFTDALIIDPQEASRQALSIVQKGVVQSVEGARVAIRADTLCIHGDSEHALPIVRAVRSALMKEGIEVRAP